MNTLQVNNVLVTTVVAPRALRVCNSHELHRQMGRLAAKKAIWKIMRDADASFPPAQIEILNAKDGSPYCSGSTINISIAHTDGLAVAAASQTQAIGVDVERVDRYSGKEFPQMAFSDDERQRIEQRAGSADSITLTRIWTAKEAAGKTAKLGLGQILKQCRFVGCNYDLSIITLSLGSPGLGVMQIDVRTVQKEDYFLALAVV